MAKRGRPAWIPTPEIIEEVEKYAGHGMTQAQICLALGISEETICQKKKIYSELAEAINRGRNRGLITVVGQLMKQIKEGNTSATIFYLKTQARWAETVKQELSGPDGQPLTSRIEVVFVEPEK